MKSLLEKSTQSSDTHYITNQAYHGTDAFSSTGARLILKSPGQFYFQKQRPKLETAPMTFGTAFHMAVLEPSVFTSSVLVQPQFDARTNAGKAIRDTFKAEAGDKIVISQEDMSAIKSMAYNVFTHNVARSLLTDSYKELSFFFKDAETGVDCKIRPDAFTEKRILIDLKSTEDCSEDGFRKSIGTYGYHQQAAFYLDGMSELTGEKWDTFIFIAVEKRAPHAVETYILDDAAIEKGRELNQKALKIYAECLKTNKWPLSTNELRSISIPNWAYGVK